MSTMSCALGEFGPAPEGLNYCEDKNATIIGPVVTFMAFGIIAVAVRMGCRYSARQNTMGGILGWLAVDDYFLLGALAMATSTAICCFLGVYFGGGGHLWAMTLDKFNHLWKTLFAFVVIYVAGVSLTKTSILLFYYRLFNTNVMWWVALFLVVGYFVSITVTAFLSCRPMSYFWTQYTDPTATGTCINIPSFFFINGICAMLIDVLVLATPLPTIYKLNMPPGKKALVAAILLLGSFVCIASVVRIVALHNFTEATDVVWSMADVFVWSCCEPFVGIICACLPTYGPLFVRFSWFRGSSGRSNDGPSAGPSGNLSGGKDLVTIGGSRMVVPLDNKKSIKSKGWSRLSKGDNLSNNKSTSKSQQQSNAFRTRPDEDEIELTSTVQGGKEHHREHHHEAYNSHADGSARSTTQASDSDGAEDQKNMQVHVKRDMSWQVEFKK